MTMQFRDFNIEIELGDPPKPFYFHIDTGSGSPWVHCDIPNSYHESTIRRFGPNGLFVSNENSIVKCTGATASLCRALQAKVECKEEDNYECRFSVKYGDGSLYVGVVVNESITVPMLDKTEKNVFVLFGCVFRKSSESDRFPLLSDGVVGLGMCEGSLVDQLSTSMAISQKVLGVCLAKEMRWRPLGLRPVGPAGYISLGMDFKEKFYQSKSVWAKLVGPEKDCLYAANLLSVFIGKRRIAGMFQSADSMDAGMRLFFDTGSDLAYLRKDMYDQVLEALETFATNGGYRRVPDHEDNFIASEQRVCWKYRGKKRKHDGNPLVKAPPIHDFRPLKFGLEGIATTKIPQIHHLIVQPENYLTWDADRRTLCVNIIPSIGGRQFSCLGVQMMREHLFVFDIENHRVRWKSSSKCEL